VPIENIRIFDDALLSILREARPFPAKPSAQYLRASPRKPRDFSPARPQGRSF